MMLGRLSKVVETIDPETKISRMIAPDKHMRGGREGVRSSFSHPALRPLFSCQA